MEIGPLGSMAIALDPQGNAFGLWQSGTHTGVRAYNEAGTLGWNEAAVDDPDAARRFYAAVFDYTFDEVPDAGGYAVFRTRGLDRPPDYFMGGLGGIQPGNPKGWLACFTVQDTDDTVARVERAGGKVVLAPVDSPYGRFAIVEDPWGAPFEVIQAPS
jgi:predicted enzyme related to lactoylglutathione lyase